MTDHEVKGSSSFPMAAELGMSGRMIMEVDVAGQLVDGQMQFSYEESKANLSAGNVDWEWCCRRKEFGSSGSCYMMFATESTSTLWRMEGAIEMSMRAKMKDDYADNNITLPAPVMKKLTPVYKYKWRHCYFDISNDDFAAIMPSYLAEGAEREDEGFNPFTHTVVFEMQFNILKSSGFRNRSRFTYNLFSQGEDSDLAVTLNNDKVVYVNSGYLAQLSAYFFALRKRLLEALAEDEDGDDKDDLLKVTIDEDAEEFAELMLVVYPSKKDITKDNVPFLLRLADRFLFDGVLADCEKFLITPAADQIDVFSKLQWSSLYLMADLQNTCLNSLSDRESIHRIRNNPIYNDLSYDVMNSLFERLMNLG